MSLILCLTAGLLSFSFSRLPERPLWVRWLIAALVGIFCWQLDNVIAHSFHPDYLKASGWHRWELVFLYGLSSLFILLAQMQLAYLFPKNPYGAERRVASIVVTALLGLVWVYYAYHVLSNAQTTPFEEPYIIAVPGAAVIAWTATVYVRKYLYFRPLDRGLMAACGFLLAMELLFMGSEVVALTIGIYSTLGYWLYFVMTWLGILGGAMVYITYSTVPITLRLRLVGFTFILVMAVMSAVTLTLFPPFPPGELARRADLHASLVQIGSLVLLATLLVMVVYPSVLRVSILRPLENLLIGVENLRDGDLDTVVSVSSNDEIGYLTGHFNGMAQTLLKARNELAEYASDLESKVAQRTADLEESMEYLKATQDQLVRREKMASLGELMTGIAHEIQNPLNFVNNFSEFAVELVEDWKAEEAKPESDDEVLAETMKDIELNLVKINEHGKRADAIVQGMLMQSRTGAARKEATDLNQLANEYLRLSYRGYTAEKENCKISLKTELDTLVGEVPVVVKDLSRALVNLFNNAYYAVEMRARSEGSDYVPSVALRSRQLPGGVEVRVWDNGIGIPVGLRQKVFQPFFTTKPPGEGVGLGLSFAYDVVVNDHGGTIDVRSEEGSFCEFFLTIPNSSATPAGT